MTVTFEGGEELRSGLARHAEEAPTALDSALFQEANAIFAKSQRLVPVRYGHLKGSGVVEGPTNGVVLIGYGGPAAPYALIVHEDLEAAHKPGRQAKYLEEPFEAALPGLEDRLARRVKATL
jgi:hypothetical protein